MTKGPLTSCGCQRRLHLESLEQRNLMAGDAVQATAAELLPEQFQNPPLGSFVSLESHRRDTNADLKITPADALLVINHLNRPDAQYDPAVDVNRDGVVTPLDPLLIINYISRQYQGHAEAVQQATEDLAARLIVSPEDIQLISVAVKQWGDSSVGLGLAEGALTVMTPYLEIFLRCGDERFEYRAPRVGLLAAQVPTLVVRGLDLEPIDSSGMTLREADEAEQVWQDSQVKAAAENLSRLLRTRPELITVSLVEPVTFDAYGRGIGRGEYSEENVDGFRIVLRYRYFDADLEYEYRAVDSPVLVLHDLPAVHQRPYFPWQ